MMRNLAFALLAALVVAGCSSRTKPPTQTAAPSNTWPTARDADLPHTPLPAGGQFRILMETPANTQPVLMLSAKGDQIYTVTTGPDGKPQWSAATPDARLYDDAGKQVGTHGKGPSWTLTDGGAITAQLPPAKKAVPDPAAVPWLELNAKPGSATGSLKDVTVIQRTSTTGGVPNPADLTPANAGKEFRVPYTAQYLFFRPK